MTLVYGADFIRAIQALLPMAGKRTIAEVHVAVAVTRVTVSAASAGLGGVCALGPRHTADTDGEVHDLVLTADQVALLARAFPAKDLDESGEWLRLTRLDDRHAEVALAEAELGDRIELYLTDSLRSPGDLATVVLDDHRKQAEAADPADRLSCLQLDPDRARVFLSATKHLPGDVDFRQAEDGAPIIGNIGTHLAGYMMPAGWFPDKTDDDELNTGAGIASISIGQTTIYDHLETP